MKEYEIYERLIIVTTSIRIHSFIGFTCLSSFVFENIMLLLGYVHFDVFYVMSSIFLTLGFFENKKLFQDYVKEYDDLQEKLKNLFDK